MAEGGLRAERKIVTVLFADLVGFTSRADALDPEDVEAILAPYHARLRGELERRGGTVEKFIGDAVMALFGAPITHEDDAERAVRAALAIRDWAREDEAGIQVRVAVTTGEALVKLDARPEHGEGMAAGDVVNTAARLQTAAPTNGILVDDATRRLTERPIEYRTVEAIVAKGKQDPIHVWEVVEARSRLGVDVLQSQIPLVGRERELELLRGTFERVQEHREPQLVTLVGVPGIGKSRLVYELLRIVDEQPELVTWRQGRSLPYGDGVTFWALSEMVKAQAGILDNDTTDQAAERLSKAVSALIVDPSEARWIESHLRPLVGLASGAEFAGEHRDERFAAWTRFFEAAAEAGAAVLVFEDLHWGDEELLDFVDHLAEWAADVPLMLVGTARPELLDRRPDWGGGKRNATTLSLSPLSDPEIRTLIDSVLGDASTETPGALLARAGGNPLYAEQFAHMLLETAGADDLPLPGTVHGLIAARLDALGVQEKRLLQDASVLGKVFWVEPLISLGGGDRVSIEAHLHGLVRKEFVRRTRRTSVADEVEYAFAHALVRDVAYGQVPRRDRAEKHLAVARWIEQLSPDRVEDRAEMLAHHYVSALDLAAASGDDSDELRERARHWLTQAGDRAHSLNALPAAARFYEAALRLSSEHDDDRPALLLRYGKSRPDDSMMDEALLVEAAESLAGRGDQAGAAEAEVMVAFIWWVRGSRDRMAEHLERARSLVEGEPSSPAKAHVLSDLARSRMLANEHRAAIEVGQEAMRMAEALGLNVLMARILCTIGTSRGMLGEPEGIADLERSLQLATELQSLYVRWNAANNLATVFAEWGELDRVGVLHDDPALRNGGSDSDRRWMLVERAQLSYHTGDWQRAEGLMDTFDESARPGVPHYMEFWVRDLRGRLALARGALGDALEASAQEVELTREIADPQALFIALGTRMKCLREAGRIQEAEPLADEVLARWHASEALSGITAALDVAWTLRSLGREGDMLAILDAKTWRPRWFDAAERILRGDLAGAAEICGRIGSLPEEAEAHMRAAEELPPDDPERSEHARQALDLYRRLGASALIRRCEAVVDQSAR